MPDDLKTMSLERLRRKRDQHWEMAGCARHDRDTADELRHTELARKYEAEIGLRVRSQCN